MKKRSHFRAAHARQRGVALLLVLFAVAISVIVSLSFATSQGTSTAVASNALSHARARTIAESALNLALQEMRNNGDWRTAYANGAWVTDQAFDGGTFTITGEDGIDTDGDGVVDGDGDLADDGSDLMTLTAVATFGGVTHRVRAIITPGEVALGPITVLMAVGDVDSLTDNEQTRKEMIESWGWTVELIDSGANLDAYNTAMLDGAHVLYVPDDGGSSSVGTVLKDFGYGVVFEDGDMNATLGLASGSASYTSTDIDIVDNSHYITSPFTIGGLTVATSAGSIEYPAGTVAAAVRQLAWMPDSSSRVLGTVDAGATLQDGSSAAGRRVTSPLSGFAADDLTDDGQLLFKRSLEWSAQSAMSNDTVEALGNWTTSSTVTAPDGDDRLLIVTVGAETHKTVTDVTYGYQPLTLAASAYESTGVGARTYIYYAREVSIAAATDSVVRVTWSGSGSDKAIASRMYQYVNQADPIRSSNTATNAGPPSISTTPLTVSDGDMVVGTAQVGQPYSYSWTSPMVMGINDVNSTSTHTAADYAVTGSPGTVTATATVNNPNRQGLAAIVLQARSQSSGEGVIPQLLVLYEFNEDEPVAELKGHWTLNDSGTGGAIAIKDEVTLNNNSVIDGYHGNTGTYSASNHNQPVILVSNTNRNGGIDLNNASKLWGSTYNRPGGNPTNVVSISSGAEITGNRYEQSVSFSLPSNSSPSSSGWTNFGSQTVNISLPLPGGNYQFSDLTISSGSTLTCIGDVRFWVTGDFELAGRILVPDGASFELYAANSCVIDDGVINTDTTGGDRVKIHHYANNKDFTMSDDAVICGTVHVGRDLIMEDDATIYGAVYVADDITLNDDAAIHIDLDLPGFHIVPVADETGTNQALANGGVLFGQSGANGSTGDAMYFDGDDDFVLIPHHDDYLLHHGTISFWFRPSSLSGDRGLFSKDSSGYDSGGHLTIYTDGSTLKAKLEADGSSPYGTGNSFTVSKSGLSTNNWYHVTVTVGAGGLNLYLNGSLQDTENYPGGLATSSGGIGNYEPLVLGANTDNSGDLNHMSLHDYFRGRMDDVRIYQEVLDASQVSNLYAGNALGNRSAASYVVRDTSGLGTALDLFVDDTAAVDWEDGGGLTFDSGTVLRSPSGPSKIRNGITATSEFTIELVVKPSTVDSSDRRLLWYGPSTGTDTNLDIFMDDGAHEIRLRNEDTSDDPTAFAGSNGMSADTEYHVLFTFDGESIRVYRDGVQVGESEQPGHMLSWDEAYGLTLGNLPDGSAPWLGTISRVAVYDRAMNQRQTDNLVTGLPPGDGASTVAGGMAVQWRECQ